MFESGIITALSVISLFWWIGFKRISKLGLLTDITTFIVLCWLFEGTYSGMMTGAWAALLVSVFLRCIRYYYRTGGIAHVRT